MIAVAQLGFRTCRGSASCGGFCSAHFSFSFVTQASCGQGSTGGRTIRGLSGVGRGQGGRSRAQRACCVVAIFCWRRVVNCVDVSGLCCARRQAVWPALLWEGAARRVADTDLQTSAQLGDSSFERLHPAIDKLLHPAIRWALLLGTSFPFCS